MDVLFGATIARRGIAYKVKRANLKHNLGIFLSNALHSVRRFSAEFLAEFPRSIELVL